MFLLKKEKSEKNKKREKREKEKKHENMNKRKCYQFTQNMNMYSNLWFRGILSGVTRGSPTESGSILSLFGFVMQYD